MKTALLVCFILLFTSCSDDAQVYIQDKNILDTQIECMQFEIIPQHDQYRSALETSYDFSATCPYTLVVSYKTNIVCNSNQNWAQKTSGIPTGYLRMELKKNNTLLYTYYKDLKSELSNEEIIQGLKRIQKDLNFKN